MNRSLTLAVVAMFPLVAFAQEDDVAEVGASVPGMNLNIKVKDQSHRAGAEAKSAVHEEQSGDGFRLTRDSDPDGDTWFKVVSPEGAQIRVLDDVNFPKAAGTVPVSFQAQGKKFYQIELRTPGGTQVKKIEAKTGMVTSVWMTGGGNGPPPAPSRAEAPSAGCASDGDMQELAGAISGESFSAGKLRVLEAATQSRGFCADQIVALIKLYDFDADKISALKLLAPRLADRQNKFKIYKAFDFDASRDQAKKILQ